MSCTNKKLFQSLKFCPGEVLAPGIRTRMYYIGHDDIVKWPELPNLASAKMGELATYKGDFTLASDAKFLAIDLVNNKGEVTWEHQGEEPSKLFMNKFTANLPNIDEQAAGFQRQILAIPGVFLVQQRDGKFRVLGCKAYKPEVAPKGGTGEGVTGAMGSQIEISATDFCPAPFYTGKIVTEDGEISGATGEPVGG